MVCNMPKVPVKKGGEKSHRKHQAHWKDSTRTARSNKRKAEMQDAAERDGFATWSEAITAWKNGEAVLVKVNSK